MDEGHDRSNPAGALIVEGSLDMGGHLPASFSLTVRLPTLPLPKAQPKSEADCPGIDVTFSAT
jgi:hypothetical protein